MFKTITTWPQTDGEPNPPNAAAPTIRAAAQAIPGFIELVKENGLDFTIRTNETADSNGRFQFSRIVTRTWATREAAQQWVDYISDNYQQVSTIIEEVE